MPGIVRKCGIEFSDCLNVKDGPFKIGFGFFDIFLDHFYSIQLIFDLLSAIISKATLTCSLDGVKQMPFMIYSNYEGFLVLLPFGHSASSVIANKGKIVGSSYYHWTIFFRIIALLITQTNGLRLTQQPLLDLIIF
jgi:hypothetical protein